MSANEIQIGGEHYKSEYQHWDWVHDIRLHYYLCCATKYIARYRNKNGLQDLEKAKHYIAKAKEKKIPGVANRFVAKVHTDEFCLKNKLTLVETDAVENCVLGNYDKATYYVTGLIDLYKQELSHEDNTGQEHPFGFDPEKDVV